MYIPAKYRVAKAKESQNIDAETVNQFGIDGFTLMELAGSSAAKIIRDKVAPGNKGLFLCGKGNNGGDALVAARYLAQHNIRVSVVFITGTDDLSPSAQQNYRLLQKIADNDAEVSINIIQQWSDVNFSAEADFIVDGMLGTGLDSDLRGNFTDTVQWVNNQSCPVFAMDIPTGIHADTGQTMGQAIQSTHTFTFGLLKQGYYLNDGKQCTGEIHFCELPFPNYISKKCTTHLIDESWIRASSNKPARHKYEAGVVYIIAGSEGLTGAAIMAAKSAWAEGVGAVILICPRGVLPVFENNLPQIIKKPVGKQGDFYFKNEHLDDVQSIIEEKEGSVLIGPGLGRKDTTVQFVNQFLANANANVVIDADALWALAQQENWEKPGTSSWILTPHPGELTTLTDTSIKDDYERLDVVQKLCRMKDITLLSKGFPVIVGTSTGATYLTDYDTRIFSRAGFGDILAGKTAAYVALSNQLHKSCIRALLNGKAKADSHQGSNKKNLEPFDLI